MELMEKQGFKQTEVGLIPNDWIVLPQKDAVKYINGRAYSINEWESSGIPVVRLQNLTQRGGRFYYSNLNLPEYQYMYKGDLIFMWSASFGPYIWWGDKAIFHYHIWKIECNNKITDKQFYYHKLVQLTEELKKGTSGSTMLHLTKDSMEKYLFALPPSLEEQKAIATALSDVDELIANLEKLITKKKAIKQGAMQQLLTPPHKGGKRLEGFSGEWLYLKIEQVADCLDNLRVPLNGEQRNKMQGDIPYCGANGVVDFVNDFVIDDDIILIAEDGGYFDEYKTRPIAYRMTGKCWVNNHAHILKSKKGYSQGFLYFSLVHKNILDYINGGTRAKLNKGEMSKIECWFPNKYEEQKAISEILSDMDFEIEQLESKKTKYQSLKQGMMQELLTGKTRLI